MSRGCDGLGFRPSFSPGNMPLANGNVREREWTSEPPTLNPVRSTLASVSQPGPSKARSLNQGCPTTLQQPNVSGVHGPAPGTEAPRYETCPDHRNSQSWYNKSLVIVTVLVQNAVRSSQPSQFQTRSVFGGGGSKPRFVVSEN